MGALPDFYPLESFSRFESDSNTSAFASTALFDGSMQELVVGDPVSGLIEATSGDNLTAQLTGWEPISAAEWKLRHPRSFHEGGFELIGDALASLPAISSGHFGHTRPPNVGYSRTRGRQAPKYFDQPVGPVKDGRGRGSSQAPRNSPERRIRGRFYKKQAGKLDAALSAAASRRRHPMFKAPPFLLVSALRSLDFALMW